MLTAISPIDGRYSERTKVLSPFFSEFALIKYRVFVEVEYFVALAQLGVEQLKGVSAAQLEQVRAIAANFTEEEAAEIKKIERTTNHDVKAVEYFLRTKFEALGLNQYVEFIHFGLTSQDINNTAVPVSLKDAQNQVLMPMLEALTAQIKALAESLFSLSTLSYTHGQPASPSSFGKEILVFVERLNQQIDEVKRVKHCGKFGGATGNFNAHYVAYPKVNWHQFGHSFLNNHLGIERSIHTTQIEHYDFMAAYCQAWSRVNTILIDFCRDIWTYISMDFFKQKTVAGEVGSSAMPHKVNPIDFENAEGNLGLANAILYHLAQKLPISRLQRDLTDSTVLRNLGVPFGHIVVSLESIKKGIGKLVVNEQRIKDNLDNNWIILAEAVQTILRRENYPHPYETLRQLTRGKSQISQTELFEFVDTLEIADSVKAELRQLTPSTYVGRIENINA
jgi:adenylosuccinate lyase